MYANNHLFAQQNLIRNPEITGTTGATGFGPFVNDVPFWRLILQTPDLMDTLFNSSPTVARVWGYVPVNWGGDLHCEAFAQNIDPLIPGERYAFSMMIYRFGFINGAQNGTGTAQAMLSFRNLMPANISSISCPDIDVNIQKQVIADQTPSTNSYLNVQSCFTADDDYNIIVFYSNATTAVLHWIQFDDVELYRVHADAGNDTSLCDTTQCVTIGTDYDSMMNISHSFEWFILGDTIPFAFTDTVTVCPKQSTSYLFRFTIAGCSDSDTVVVCVNPYPIVELGPNDTICGSCKILDAGYDSSCTYLWSSGKTTHADTVCKTGWYWVKVTNSCGCETFDSVHLVVRPDFVVEPKDTIFCDNPSSWPVTLRVKAGYERYKWTTLDTNIILSTSNTVQVTQTGAYIIIVEDSGCIRMDTAYVQTLTAPWFSLGPDIEACDSVVELCGPFDSSYTYIWSTSATSRCISVTSSGTYWLEIMTIDSCFSRDTINVILHPKPVITCSGSFGPYCEGHPPVRLSGCSPINGVYTGTSVSKTGNFLSKTPGLNTVIYTYTDTNGCKASDSFYIEVYDDPDFVLDPPKTPLCITDPSIIIEIQPDSFHGGSWSGTTYDSLFNPSSAGAGSHLITYRYTDSNGCTDSASIVIDVIDTFTAYITTTNPDN